MTFLENNKKAIETAEISFGKLRDAESRGNPGDVISYLRTLGLGCAHCGSNVTWPTLKFYQFSPDVICYDCQEKEKLGIK